MTKSVFGIAKSESHADSTVRKLIDAGFESDHISTLFHNEKNKLQNSTFDDRNPYAETNKGKKTGELGIEKHTKAAEGAATGATAGGILGGTLGLLAGIGSIAIPGLGAFVAAGPIMAALGGSAVGGGLGLLLGALTGLGIPEYEAKKYEDRLKNGGVLISVHCETSQDIDRAKHIFEENKIEDIATGREKATSSRNQR